MGMGGGATFVGVGHSIFYAHFALANGNEREEQKEYSHGT